MRILSPLILVSSLAAAGYAAEPGSYDELVKPLLLEKCSACHGALKQEADLRLDAGRLIRAGSESGPVVEPGNADRSLIIERVSSADLDERMPPEGAGEPLSTNQILLLKSWIDHGAEYPEGEVIPANPREHWAYQAPVRPKIPTPVDSRWSHPIDAFVAEQHQRLELTAVDLADQGTLVRRAFFDLIGLPPTRDQLAGYTSDSRPAAWESLIASLLEDSHYGERWGRHWMDVWRYSDWDGYKNELRGSQRHIWHWRDWIIESLNQDKGYDRMVVEMLAGDELAPEDQSTLAATGFLARNFHKSNRNIWLDATVEHTAKAFLGVTLNCARCHDHKYDPIPQLAYYQFRAIFEPHQVRTDRVPGQLDVSKNGIPRAYDSDLAAQTFVFLQGNDKQPDKDHPVAPATPAMLGGRFNVEPVSLPVTAYFPALQGFVVNDQLELARRDLEKAQLALVNRKDQQSGSEVLSADRVALLERRRAVAQLEVYAIEKRENADRAKYVGEEEHTANERARVAANIEEQLRLERAELAVQEKRAAVQDAAAKDQGKDAQQALVKAKKELTEAEMQLDKVKEAQAKEEPAKYTPLGEEYPTTSSGRRLALARWITSPNNPLTARVAVNHIWMRHFGAPLVDNVFDFGLRSPRPRHADLLDWLAVELMEHEWSMKHIHKLILTSRTWRLRSSEGLATSPNASIDRDNQYLWRMNVRRLDAELIRDNVLAVSGRLDEKMGGADIDYRKGEETSRRSIYLRHAYEKQMTMLVLFDAASPNECYRRSESIVPQQALALANSPLSLNQSRVLARRLWKEVTDHEAAEAGFVNQAFLQVLSRPAAKSELEACLDFLTTQAQTLSQAANLTTFRGGSDPKVEPAADPDARARENLVHVLMNHNDFVTVR